MIVLVRAPDFGPIWRSWRTSGTQQLVSMVAHQPNLVRDISDLRKSIEEGRSKSAKFRRVQERYFNSIRRCEAARVELNELGLRGTGSAELDKQRLVVDRLQHFVSGWYRSHGESVEYIAAIANRVTLLSKRLPLEPRWQRFVRALLGLEVWRFNAWTDPSATPDLEILDLRLGEMLVIANSAAQVHDQPMGTPEIGNLAAQPTAVPAAPGRLWYRRLDVNRIKTWMEDEGHTRQTLAAKFHKSPRTISSLLNNGCYHGKALVERLASLMGLGEPTELYRG